jgi:hypothetical protein
VWRPTPLRPLTLLPMGAPWRQLPSRVMCGRIRDRSRNLSFAIIWGVISALWLAMGMLVPLLWGAESTWVDMAVWALLCSVMGLPASDAAQ